VSMRVPNPSAPMLGRSSTTSHHHRRPAYIYEEDDDDDEPPPPPRSGPGSRPARSRRAVSPQSGRHYRSTPSRQSPRTSVSESEYETDVTMDSDDERAMYPPPPHDKVAEVAPVSRTLMHERLNRNRDADFDDGRDRPPRDSRHAPSNGRHPPQSRQPSRQPSHRSSNKRDEYRRPRTQDFRDDAMVMDDSRSYYGSKR